MIAAEKIQEVIENDLSLHFDRITKTYPVLAKSRSEVFARFSEHYELLTNLNQIGSPITYASLVINGILLRSLNYYRGALFGLGLLNNHVFYECLRAQVETLCLAVYCEQNKDYILAAAFGSRGHTDDKLKIKKISDLVKFANSTNKGLRADYDTLSNIVHPNPESLHANFEDLPVQVKNGKKINSLRWGTKSPKLSDEHANKQLGVLNKWTKSVIETFKKIPVNTKNSLGRI